MKIDYKEKFLKKIHADKQKSVKMNDVEREKNDNGYEISSSLFLSQILKHDSFIDKIKDAEKTITDKGYKLKAELKISEGVPSFIKFYITNRYEDEFNIELYVPSMQSIIIHSNECCLHQLNDLGEYDYSHKVKFPQERGKVNCGIKDILEAQDQFLRSIYEIGEAMND